ncbi:hypothetical protein [Candidatus Tisiphia endosymbiont of Beris chalybata]
MVAPIYNRQALSDDVTNFSSIDYIYSVNFKNWRRHALKICAAHVL